MMMLTDEYKSILPIMYEMITLPLIPELGPSTIYRADSDLASWGSNCGIGERERERERERESLI